MTPEQVEALAQFQIINRDLQDGLLDALHRIGRGKVDPHAIAAALVELTATFLFTCPSPRLAEDFRTTMIEATSKRLASLHHDQDQPRRRT